MFPLMPTQPGQGPSSLQDFLATLTGGGPAPMLGGPAPAPMGGAPVPTPAAPAGPGGALPLPTGPAGPSLPPQQGGGGLGALLQTVMPAIFAALAAKQGGPSAAGAMLQGIAASSQQRRIMDQRRLEVELATARDEQDRQFKLQQWQREQDQKKVAFQTDAMETLSKITDPGQYAKTAQLYESMGQQLFELPTGWLETAAPEPDAAAGAQERIDKIKKLYGDDQFGYLLERDAIVEGKPLSEWLALAGLGATDPETGGLPVPPSASGPAGTSDFSNYLRTVYADFESREGRAPNAAERRRLSLDARKEFNQVDDRPADPMLSEIRDLNAQVLRNQLNTGMTSAQQSRVETIANSFRSEPVVKRVQTQAEAVDFVNRLSDTSTSPADDQALIYAFAKAMDPESVVREGEYATVQKYAQSWLESFGFNAQRVISNTEFLSPEARRNMKATIRKRYQTGLGQYNNIRRQFGRQINRITGQGNGEDFLIDYGAAFPTGDAPDQAGVSLDAARAGMGDAPAAPAQPAAVGDRRMINGTLAEWDGTGWKAVGQ